jgi:hypothetical protein
MSPRAWAAVGLGLLAIDAYAAWVKHDGTASHAVRLGFHTDTPAGKVALCATWAGLTAYVLPHWCTWPVDKIRQSL